MKKLLLIGCLALAGCAGQSATGGTLNSRVAEIQKYTKLFCSFVPTISTVANILSSGSASPITAIAQDICNAVTTAPLADGGSRQAKVNGVVIRGKFVR